VIRPAEPSAPRSTPSYSRCATAHGALHAEPAARGLLLQGAGDERGKDCLFPLFPFRPSSRSSRCSCGIDDRGGFLFVRNRGRAPRLPPWPVPRRCRQTVLSAAAALRWPSRPSPTPESRRWSSKTSDSALKFLDLLFALHDQPHGDGLHAPRGESPPHLIPQQRRNLIADDPIQHAPRLLARPPDLHPHPARARTPRAPPSG